MKVDADAIKKVIGWAGYFGASSTVAAFVMATANGAHPVLRITSYIGGVGLGMAAGDVAQDKLLTTLERF